jgi:hypothetical protein
MIGDHPSLRTICGICTQELMRSFRGPLVSSHVKICWQLCWNSDTNNKLFKIQPVIKSFVVNRLPHRDEILIYCLRVEHADLTHSYLLRRKTPPECDFCHVRLTVEHVLLSCCKYNPLRRKFYNVNSLQDLFVRVKPQLIVAYVKEIGLCRKL